MDSEHAPHDAQTVVRGKDLAKTTVGGNLFTITQAGNIPSKEKQFDQSGKGVEDCFF